MTWTKIGAEHLGDPKFRQVGPHAELAYIRSLIYSNRYLTDGVITADAVREVCQGFERQATAVAAALVKVALWEASPDGYVVINFTLNQRSKKEVMDDLDSNR